MHKFDLEERTMRFARSTIRIVSILPRNPVNIRMVEQVVASAGSVGANYCEATEAESKKDFAHKIGICKKEIKESRHWLNLLAYANPSQKNKLQELISESQELLFIFAKIFRSVKKN